MPTNLQIRLDDSLTAELDARPRGRAEAARTMLQRYLGLLAVGRQQLDGLTEAEWNLCRDALNGTWLLDGHAAFCVAAIRDACQLSAAHKKWGVDSDHMLGVLDRLDEVGKIALADAVERWWAKED